MTTEGVSAILRREERPQATLQAGPYGGSGKRKPSLNCTSHPSKKQTIRAFIAVELPLPVKQWLTGIQNRLKKDLGNASWPGPNSFHLTLAFLGHIPKSDIVRVVESMDKAVYPYPGFELYASGLGVFPSAKNPRVLWAGIRGRTDMLHALVNELEQELQVSAGYKTNKKRFTPHLTLARIKPAAPNKTKKRRGGRQRSGPLTPGRVIQWMQEFQTDQSEPFDVKKIGLMKSTLHATGAVHEHLYSANLRN